MAGAFEDLSDGRAANGCELQVRLVHALGGRAKANGVIG
jgi:hypothetical protein